MLSFEDVLARLLCEPALRAEFTGDPAACVRDLGVDGALAARLVQLHPPSIERQAQALLDKRLLEVRLLLPVTVGGLGDAARVLFAEHARDFWPEGAGRHARDAVAFAAFLRDRRAAVDAREVNWLRFEQGAGTFHLHPVRCRVRSGARRAALQVLLRWRGRSVERVFYLG